MPKIIVKLSKAETDAFYSFGLSVIWFIWALLFAIALLFGIGNLIAGDASATCIMELILFYVIFAALIIIEVKLTSMKIKKVVQHF